MFDFAFSSSDRLFGVSFGVSPSGVALLYFAGRSSSGRVCYSGAVGVPSDLLGYLRSSVGRSSVPFRVGAGGLIDLPGSSFCARARVFSDLRSDWGFARFVVSGAADLLILPSDFVVAAVAAWAGAVGSDSPSVAAPFDLSDLGPALDVPALVLDDDAADADATTTDAIPADATTADATTTDADTDIAALADLDAASTDIATAIADIDAAITAAEAAAAAADLAAKKRRWFFKYNTVPGYEKSCKYLIEEAEKYEAAAADARREIEELKIERENMEIKAAEINAKIEEKRAEISAKIEAAMVEIEDSGNKADESINIKEAAVEKAKAAINKADESCKKTTAIKSRQQ